MKVILGVCLMLLCSVRYAFAYQVTPMYMEMEYVGSKAQSSYQVTNTSNKEVRVQVSVQRIEIDPETNEETTLEADEDFLILPPQAIVAANSVRRFRVRYLGSEQVQSTHTYRVLFEEVQTNDGTVDDAQVKFLFNFSTVVFVSPTAEECSNSLSYKVQTDYLILINQGNCVLNVSQAQLTFSKNGQQKTMSWNELEFENKSNYLLPKVIKKYKLSQGNKGSAIVEFSLN
ncbi:molecular chaperone [Vibrio sp. B1Z05]|uniref:fimbrial biogenesis chaperone n=1 Tax=Vibrio sp. B1Z05 TaxID=2654980 RepID=UPI00128E87F1|nr:fimbria/pilus periplasmic chaperone [Vibrio sp. B1Z05]MPW36324.1 fimbria/pilus periplasmic chaperone [Vibrio sp. B1Z05]